MYHTIVVLCAAALLAGSLAAAQTASPQTPEQRAAAYDAHKGDFDYLLGDWEFTGNNREFGMVRGHWSALRLSEGQILDEFRVVSDGGDTVFVTTTIRSYNAFVDRWELLGMDRGNGLQDMGTGGRDGGEIRIEQRFGVAAGGTPNILRIRYHDIGRIVSPGRPIDPLTAARPGCAPFRRSRLDASGPPVRWAHWHRRENEDIIRELRALIG